jgi:hypothetical protein
VKSYNADKNITDIEVIKKAVITVCKSKKSKNGRYNAKYKMARKILEDVDRYALEIKEMLDAYKRVNDHNTEHSESDLQRMYVPSECKTFNRRDNSNGKIREIASVPLWPDQIVHQVIIESSKDFMASRMYYHSYGSIPGKGAHKGAKFVKRYIKRSLKNDRSAIKYCAKLDIQKCYQSIRHAHVESVFRSNFRGWLFVSLVMSVLSTYIKSYDTTGPVGISIGYSTSQWICNFVLTPLDRQVKGDCQFYVRYIDDIVIFSRNKKHLHQKEANNSK